jgi:superfamily II DNA or RNA helicase
MDKNKRISKIEKQIKKLETEKQNLIKELEAIKENTSLEKQEVFGIQVSINPPKTAEEKIDLFNKLFCCRTDVYPRMWQSKTGGKKGYSPVCKHEWDDNLCGKPEIKCSACSNRSFSKLDNQVIRSHLEGKITIGTYTIRDDDTCSFLAADFDKSSWQLDVMAFKKAGHAMGIEIYIERSRSGNGAHAWLFFSEPVVARLARQLGSLIVVKASLMRHDLSLDSHDRFFPSQDTIPKGGFGNLIALPLQRNSRLKGNSVFINNQFQPHENQWIFLSKCRRLSATDVSQVLDKNIKLISQSFPNSEKDVRLAEETLNIPDQNIKECHTGNISVYIGSKLTIDINGLPSKLITSLKRTATFANPKFFELQRLRFSTWKTPKYIFCGEISATHLTLPRGVIEKCSELLAISGANIKLKDYRLKLENIEIKFLGDLSLQQDLAVTQLINHENGVLVAPTGSGKTVMACKIIAARNVPTLILVHRKQLVLQWMDHLIKFLSVEKQDIGIIAGIDLKPNGLIDIAMLQTLSKKEDLAELVNKYEFIVVDECHHIPAFSFESVLNKFPARYFLGLTATPFRKDGHQPIIYMQCGPIRSELKEKMAHKINRRVIVRETTFSMPEEYGAQPPIHEIWDRLVNDKKRLEQIAQDVIQSIKANRFPLILSERKDHLFLLSETIKGMLDNTDIKGFLLIGEMSKKKRKEIFSGIKEAQKGNRSVYILSTGSLIGEGFDLPSLDTLFLAMPISFKGRVIQYAGRLHRDSPNKSDVMIYDYMDITLGLTNSMFKKRVQAYKKMGYDIETSNLKVKKWISK